MRVSQLERIPFRIFFHKDALLQAIIPTGVLLLKVLHTMYVVLQNYEILLSKATLSYSFKGKCNKYHFICKR